MAKWNPLLHPRDRKGRFIRKFGIVKFLDAITGTWKYGRAVGVDSVEGKDVVTVTPVKSIKGEPTGAADVDIASSKLYAVSAPKAHLTIANPKVKKIGGQGGSNEGGMYAIPGGKDVEAEAVDTDAPAPASVKAKLAVDPKIQELLDATPATGEALTANVNGVSIVRVGGTITLKPEIGGTWILDNPDAVGVQRALEYGFPAEGDSLTFRGAQAPTLGEWAHPKTGEKRTYINNWKTFVSDPTVTGKAWFGEDGEVHIDKFAGKDLAYAKSRVESALQDYGLKAKDVTPEPVEAPETHETAPEKFYVKKAKSAKHGRNEALANALYAEAGVYVPEVDYDEEDGQIYSKIVDGVPDMQSQLKNPEWAKQVQADFVVDAWLANRDVFGLTYDNILTDTETGAPVRIDNGGALLFRAMGSPKTDFGSEVTELEVFRTGKKAAVFGWGVMGKEVELDGAQRVLAITPEKISEMVAEHNLPASLADTLKARRKFIADYYGLPLPESIKPADAEKATTAPLVDPADVTSGGGLGRNWSRESDNLFTLAGQIENGDIIRTAKGVHTVGRVNGEMSQAEIYDELAVFAAEGGPYQVKKKIVGTRPEHLLTVETDDTIGIEKLLAYNWHRGDKIEVNGEKLRVAGVNRSTGMLYFVVPPSGNKPASTLALNAYNLPTDAITVHRWDPPALEDASSVPSVKTGMAVSVEKALKADLVTPLPDNNPPAPAVDKHKTDGIGVATPKSNVKSMTVGDNTVASTGDKVTSNVDGKEYLFVKPKGPYAVVTDPNGEDPTKQLLKKSSTLKQPGKAAEEWELALLEAPSAPTSKNGIVPTVGMTAQAKDGTTGKITMISPDGKFVFIDAGGPKPKRKSTGAVDILEDGKVPETPGITPAGTPTETPQPVETSDGGIPGHKYEKTWVHNVEPGLSAHSTYAPIGSLSAASMVYVTGGDGTIKLEKWAGQPEWTLFKSPNGDVKVAAGSWADAWVAPDSLPVGIYTATTTWNDPVTIYSYSHGTQVYDENDIEIPSFKLTEPILISGSNFPMYHKLPEPVAEKIEAENTPKAVKQLLQEGGVVVGDYVSESPDGPWDKVDMVGSVMISGDEGGMYLPTQLVYVKKGDYALASPVMNQDEAELIELIDELVDNMSFSDSGEPDFDGETSDVDEYAAKYVEPVNQSHVLTHDVSIKKLIQNKLTTFDGNMLEPDDWSTGTLHLDDNAEVPAGAELWVKFGDDGYRFYTSYDEAIYEYVVGSGWSVIDGNIPEMDAHVFEINMKSATPKGVPTSQGFELPNFESMEDVDMSALKSGMVIAKDYGKKKTYQTIEVSKDGTQYLVVSQWELYEGAYQGAAYATKFASNKKLDWHPINKNAVAAGVKMLMPDSSAPQFLTDWKSGSSKTLHKKLTKGDVVAANDGHTLYSWDGSKFSHTWDKVSKGWKPMTYELYVTNIKYATPPADWKGHPDALPEPEAAPEAPAAPAVKTLEGPGNIGTLTGGEPVTPDTRVEFGDVIHYTAPNGDIDGFIEVHAWKDGTILEGVLYTKWNDTGAEVDAPQDIFSSNPPAGSTLWKKAAANAVLPDPANMLVETVDTPAPTVVGPAVGLPDGVAIDPASITPVTLGHKFEPGDFYQFPGGAVVQVEAFLDDEILTYKNSWYVSPTGEWKLTANDYASHMSMADANKGFVYKPAGDAKTFVGPKNIGTLTNPKTLGEGELPKVGSYVTYSTVPGSTAVLHVESISNGYLNGSVTVVYGDTNKPASPTMPVSGFTIPTGSIEWSGHYGAPTVQSTIKAQPGQAVPAFSIGTPTPVVKPTILGVDKPSAEAIASWAGDLTSDGYIPSPGMLVTGKGPMSGKVISVSKDKKKAVVLTDDGKKTTRLISALKSNIYGNKMKVLGPVEPMEIPEGMEVPYDNPTTVFKKVFADTSHVGGLINSHAGVKNAATVVKAAKAPNGKTYARVSFTMTTEQRALFMAYLEGNGEPPKMGAWVKSTSKPLTQLAVGDAVSLRNSSTQGEWVLNKNGTAATHKLLEVKDDGTHVFESLDGGPNITTPFTKKSSSSQSPYMAEIFVWDANVKAPVQPNQGTFKGLSDHAKAGGWEWKSNGYALPKAHAAGGTVSANPADWPYDSNITGVSGGAKLKMADGTVIDVAAPQKGQHSEAGIVVISVPEGGDAVSAYSAAMASLQMAHAPMTQDNVKDQVRPLLVNMLSLDMSAPDSSKGWSDGKIFAEVGAAVGIPDLGWDDVRIGVHQDQGRTEFLWSDRVITAMANKSSWKNIVRGGKSYKKVVDVIKYGAMDATTRRVLGLPGAGNGHGQDSNNNAGHGSFMSGGNATKFATKNLINTSYGGGYAVYHQPAALFARIGDIRPGKGSHDAFGAGADNGSSAFNGMLNQSNSWDLWMAGGLPVDTIGFIAMNNESERASVLKELHASGITEINGRPIEEVIQTASALNSTESTSNLPAYVPQNTVNLSDLPIA